MLAQSLRVLALGLSLILVLLKLHRLHLACVSISDQRVVGDGQRPQISRVRLSGNEGVRCGLKHDPSVQEERAEDGATT